jgi:putative glutamine amidotransferase
MKYENGSDVASADAPVVWVVSSRRELRNEYGHPQQFTLVDDASVETLLKLGLQPVSYPGLPLERLEPVLDTVHGVVLGGSGTDVHPRLYGQKPPADADAQRFDEERDTLAVPLVRRCVERRLPLIGFCRGSHEINVALGGTLHQDLKARAGGVVHWEDPSEDQETEYIERHQVSLRAGGELERLTGCSRFGVSSLHSQGIERLAPGLVDEAWADDGLVEASRWHEAGQFAWAFQFHPEWKHERREPYARIMQAFRDACWRAKRRRADS